ncbi:hypothetical protein GCM10022233_40870 [Streptomyces shaanxiensis]|uniref:Uncharacterized protein n=2 Tax=Streptomyces shaanxiensis TaxID=653357 RepID=A0ABP7VA03_9ACTN
MGEILEKILVGFSQAESVTAARDTSLSTALCCAFPNLERGQRRSGATLPSAPEPPLSPPPETCHATRRGHPFGGMRQVPRSHQELMPLDRLQHQHAERTGRVMSQDDDASRIHPGIEALICVELDGLGGGLSSALTPADRPALTAASGYASF